MLDWKFSFIFIHTLYYKCILYNPNICVCVYIQLFYSFHNFLLPLYFYIFIIMTNSGKLFLFEIFSDFSFIISIIYCIFAFIVIVFINKCITELRWACVVCNVFFYKMFPYKYTYELTIWFHLKWIEKNDCCKILFPLQWNL